MKPNPELGINIQIDEIIVLILINDNRPAFARTSMATSSLMGINMG